MAILTDAHLHSYFSGDSTTPMEDMIQEAIKLQYHTICFTEHHDDYYPYTHGEAYDMFTLNPDAYLYEYLMLKEKYADRIKVLFGLELGLQPKIAQSNLTFSNQYPFDFIIGSSHLSNEKDPYYIDFFDDKEESVAYEEYFQSIIENINAFSNFDVYGHLDYIVRYGPNKNRDFCYAKYSDSIDTILKLLIEGNHGIEVNTSGLKYNLGQTHPHKDILARYKELGGTILTIGSDAHKPEHMGYEFKQVNEMLLSLGYTYYTIFEKRKPIFLPLS